MMYHRYGRYGPDAWKRRRQCLFQPCLPAIVPTVAVTVTRTQAPVNAGRIIFIVVTSSEYFDSNEPPQIPGGNPLLPQPAIPPIDNSPLAKKARIQAIDDIVEVKGLIERYGSITIQDEYVLKRADMLAREAVKSSYASGDIPGQAEYKKLVESWIKAYLGQFEEEKQPILANLKCFPDAKAVNLAKKAHQDKEKYIFPSSGRGPFHQRDLAIVSALHELNLCPNLEEHLEKIHVYVDIYEEAFRSSKEEVVWPNPASFRT